MDDLTRSLNRLEFIADDPCGIESIVTRIGDFVTYYMERFTLNIAKSFSKFARSEIGDHLARHASEYENLWADKTIIFENRLVYIPKGMIHSYADTVDILTTLLTNIHAITLLDDIKKVNAVITGGDVNTLPYFVYSKNQFHADNKVLGTTFSTSGLSLAPAKEAFESLERTKYAVYQVLSVVEDYFPQAIHMTETIRTLENNHNQNQISDRDMVTVKQSLMSMAYRLTLFAAVMNKFEDIEHGLILSLKDLRKK